MFSFQALAVSEDQCLESTDAVTPHQRTRCISTAFGAFQEAPQRLGWCPILFDVVCRLDRCRACRECNTNDPIAIDGDSARTSLLGGADRAGDVCLCDLGWPSRHSLLPSSRRIDQRSKSAPRKPVRRLRQSAAPEWSCPLSVWKTGKASEESRMNSWSGSRLDWRGNWTGSPDVRTPFECTVGGLIAGSVRQYF